MNLDLAGKNILGPPKSPNGCNRKSTIEPRVTKSTHHTLDFCAIRESNDPRDSMTTRESNISGRHNRLESNFKMDSDYAVLSPAHGKNVRKSIFSNHSIKICDEPGEESNDKFNYFNSTSYTGTFSEYDIKDKVDQQEIELKNEQAKLMIQQPELAKHKNLHKPLVQKLRKFVKRIILQNRIKHGILYCLAERLQGTMEGYNESKFNQRQMLTGIQRNLDTFNCKNLRWVLPRKWCYLWLIWDLWLFLYQNYTILLTTFIWINPDMEMNQYMNISFEILYCIEILINFFREPQIEYQTEKLATFSEISRNYLFGYFIFDLLTILDFAWLFKLWPLLILKFLRYGHQLRYIKSITFGIATIIKFFEKNFQKWFIKKVTMLIVKTIILFQVGVSTLCVFNIQIDYHWESVEKAYDMKSAFVYYFTMMYFNVATITTAGFGEQNAKIQPWYIQFTVMVIQFFGIGFYGFCIVKLNSVVRTLTLISIFEQDKLENVDMAILALETHGRNYRFVSVLDVLKNIQRESDHSNLYQIFQRKWYWMLTDIHTKQQMDYHIFGVYIKQFSIFFKAVRTETCFFILKNIQPRQCRNGHKILQTGMMSPGIYFIQKGSVQVMHPYGNTTPILEFEEKSFFGEGFQFDDEYTEEFSYIASSPSLNILFVSREIIFQALEQDPEGNRILRDFALTRIINNRYSHMKYNKSLNKKMIEIEANTRGLVQSTEMLSSPKRAKFVKKDQKTSAVTMLEKCQHRQSNISNSYDQVNSEIIKSRTKQQASDRSIGSHKIETVSFRTVERDIRVEIERLHRDKGNLLKMIRTADMGIYVDKSHYRNITIRNGLGKLHKDITSVKYIDSPNGLFNNRGAIHYSPTFMPQTPSPLFKKKEFLRNDSFKSKEISETSMRQIEMDNHVETAILEKKNSPETTMHEKKISQASLPEELSIKKMIDEDKDLSDKDSESEQCWVDIQLDTINKSRLFLPSNKEFNDNKAQKKAFTSDLQDAMTLTYITQRVLTTPRENAFKRQGTSLYVEAVEQNNNDCSFWEHSDNDSIDSNYYIDENKKQDYLRIDIDKLDFDKINFLKLDSDNNDHSKNVTKDGVEIKDISELIFGKKEEEKIDKKAKTLNKFRTISAKTIKISAMGSFLNRRNIQTEKKKFENAHKCQKELNKSTFVFESDIQDIQNHIEGKIYYMLRKYKTLKRNNLNAMNEYADMLTRLNLSLFKGQQDKKDDENSPKSAKNLSETKEDQNSPKSAKNLSDPNIQSEDKIPYHTTHPVSPDFSKNINFNNVIDNVYNPKFMLHKDDIVSEESYDSVSEEFNIGGEFSDNEIQERHQSEKVEVYVNKCKLLGNLKRSSFSHSHG